MSMPWPILSFFIILAVLIFIHELGHFLTAKLRGVKVLEFAIGFPPRIFSFQRGETRYLLNAIPLGGYCKMLGEEDPSQPRSLARQGPGTRTLVLSAGSLAMFIFPLILFSVINMVPHPVPVGGEGIEVRMVNEDSPAQFAGVKSGDDILRVNGKAVEDFEGLKTIVDNNLGSEITMLVQRDSGEIRLTMTPRPNPPPGQGPLGVGIGWANPVVKNKWYPPWEAIALGFKQNWNMWVMLKRGIAATITGKVPFSIAGIIGIGQATAEVARASMIKLVTWTAFLSINLGIINLLPFPALDGGRIVFVLLEVIRRGKRVSPKVEALVHSIGFALLIGLVIVVSYYDVLRLIQGESLIP